MHECAYYSLIYNSKKNNWQQPKCSTQVEWLGKWEHINLIKYHAVIKVIIVKTRSWKMIWYNVWLINDKLWYILITILCNIGARWVWGIKWKQVIMLKMEEHGWFFFYMYTICENYFAEINRLVAQLHTKTDLFILKGLLFAPRHSLEVQG